MPAKKWSAPSMKRILRGCEAETRSASRIPRGLNSSWSPEMKSFGTEPQAGRKS